MNKHLQSAISNLSIFSVNLRGSKVEMGDDFNVLNISSVPKKSQSFRQVIKIDLLEEVNGESANEKKLFYSFRYNVGSRLVNSEDPHEGADGTENKGSFEAIVTFEACYDVIYLAKKILSRDEVESFAANNVGYHVWPYWREHLQSTCSKVGITPIRLPFYDTRFSDLIKV